MSRPMGLVLGLFHIVSKFTNLAEAVQSVCGLKRILQLMMSRAERATRMALSMRYRISRARRLPQNHREFVQPNICRALEVILGIP